ncbi:fasciclin-like arabinogalactan protein 21 [Nymphaea colorata]|uniref:FAS1 domain-containing protein n=1 Tax=Nymphaea colorata TaxID=210225 RepID=A0A5K0WZ94_9MAGN|nr:fasciclin-like arabinogalactan protein 21 [Nymphaea colorata]
MAFSSYAHLLLLLSLFTPAFCFRHPDVAVDVRQPPPPRPPPSLHHHLASVLSSLGYQQLASAASSICDPTFFSPWDLPATVFAPSDGLVNASTFLVNEHIVPGIFTLRILSRMKSGTLLGTMSPGRCLAFTSQDNATTGTLLVNSVPIVKPDMYNDGELVVHGIGFPFAPLSPSSCEHPTTVTTATTTATSTSTIDFPVTVDPYVHPSPAFVMSLMLRDAMSRLRERGYSILALAIRVKYVELVDLHNVTVFALDDSSIFSGGHAYVSNFRFHVVPNRLLTHDDLMALPLGSLLPTLLNGERLVVTSAGTGARINYVPLRSPDLLRNLNVVVHGIFLPFPHLHQELSVQSAFSNAAFRSPASAPEGEDEPCCTAAPIARRSVLFDGLSMTVSSEDDIL